jgi:hypothetical protein
LPRQPRRCVTAAAAPDRHGEHDICCLPVTPTCDRQDRAKHGIRCGPDLVSLQLVDPAFVHKSAAYAQENHDDELRRRHDKEALEFDVTHCRLQSSFVRSASRSSVRC